MLAPQSNACRQTLDLSGFWDFRMDANRQGVSLGWGAGFAEGQPLAVPASWNDQIDAYRDVLGDGWYQTHFDRPWGWAGQRIVLRFGSVNYLAEVWLNGERLGSHEGGHLPFEFEVSAHVQAEDNRLVVRVNGDLLPDRVPPGNLREPERDQLAIGDGMGATFDFFPFCGIHRPVTLYALPQASLRDLTVVPAIVGAEGRLTVRVTHTLPPGCWLRFTLSDEQQTVTEALEVHADPLDITLTVPEARFWSPTDPHLYTLRVEAWDAERLLDRYELSVGLRTIAVRGQELLLNGEPITLRGFGRHEDFPVVGRGYLPALIVKDYQLMDWIGANSFRTSHYPYSEAMLDLADRLGCLVIAETPAVGLYFAQEGQDERLRLWHQQIRELIQRDKNHPSVILWSLANEPINRRAAALPAFEDAFALARTLDASRPVTFVGEHVISMDDPALALCDVICVNRYDGWYVDPSQLEIALGKLSADLDALYERHGKPLMLAEFGADTLPGWHANPPEMFSEEFQAAFLTGYLKVLDAKPYVVGQHIWNLCDFKTGQAVRRAGAMNYKGVFTRDRRPKLAAHRLRELWRG